MIGAICVYTWRQNPDALATILRGPARTERLLAAWIVTLLAQAVGGLRWYLLLIALEIPVRLAATLRLAFVGQLMSFVTPGQVGGDVVKAVLVAREQADRRAGALATIVLDRACGIYGLLVVASLTLWQADLSQFGPHLHSIAKATFLLTALGGIAVALTVTPAFASSQLVGRTTDLPRIGPAMERVLGAIKLYQRRPLTLFVVGLLSVLVHSLLAVATYLAASGIYEDVPSLGNHFVISPVASVAGALPITPGGLGSYELAITYLYNLLSSPENQGRGIAIALFVRLCTISAAGLGTLIPKRG